MMSSEKGLKFEIIARLGRGQFSTVYKAKWIDPSDGIYHPVPDNAQSLPLRGSGHNSASESARALNSINYAPVPSMTGVQETILNPSTSQHHYTPANEAEPRPRREKLVALKRIELCDIQNSQARMDYLKEVNLLQKVKHKNIINFYVSFIERNELFIVLELADGGDLSKLIKYFQRKKRLIPEQTILKYFTQISSAVEYIHSRRILHRDIKPANIFMTSDGCVKLGDFGLGRFFSQNTYDAHSIVGTFYYMSPERIREAGYGFSSDVWSLGCVLYELITLNSPFSIFNQQQESPKQKHKQPNSCQPTINYNDKMDFQATNESNEQQLEAQNGGRQYNLQWLMDRIMRAEYPSLDSYTQISPSLRQLAVECLNPNPDARPNMQYICAVVNQAFQVFGGQSLGHTNLLQSQLNTQQQQLVHQPLAHQTSQVTARAQPQFAFNHSPIPNDINSQHHFKQEVDRNYNDVRDSKDRHHYQYGLYEGY